MAQSLAELSFEQGQLENDNNTVSNFENEINDKDSIKMVETQQCVGATLLSNNDTAPVIIGSNIVDDTAVSKNHVVPHEIVDEPKNILTNGGTMNMKDIHSNTMEAIDKSPVFHENSSSSRENSPASHQNSPASHQNSPTSHQNSPTSRQNSPASHQNSPTSHQNSPTSHQNSPVSHQNSPTSHQNSANSHQNSATSHQNSPTADLSVESSGAFNSSAIKGPVDGNHNTSTNSSISLQVKATENPEVVEDKEEGELEEGELDDEEEEKNGVNVETKEKKLSTVLQSLPSEEEEQLVEARKQISKEIEKELKQSGDKKRKKDDVEEDDKERKKKKKHHSAESDEAGTDESSGKYRSRALSSSKDFDSLLKLEMKRRNNGGAEDYLEEINNYSLIRGGGRPDYDSDSDDNRGGKNRSRVSPGPVPPSKTEALCVHFLEGLCSKGNECQYSHSTHHNHAIQPHQRKMELCKFYMNKCCAKRQKCLYMHKDFPCKIYHSGMKCIAPDKCQFSHDPLSSVTKAILIKHLELAPKEILGSFPRLSKSAAEAVIEVTASYRARQPVHPPFLNKIRDLKGKGFKYVDKAIKSHIKKLRKEATLKVGAEEAEALGVEDLWPKTEEPSPSPAKKGEGVLRSGGEASAEEEGERVGGEQEAQRGRKRYRSGGTEGDRLPSDPDLEDSLKSGGNRYHSGGSSRGDRPHSHHRRREEKYPGKREDKRSSAGGGRSESSGRRHSNRDGKRPRSSTSPSRPSKDKLEELLAQITPKQRELFKRIQEEEEEKERRAASDNWNDEGRKEEDRDKRKEKWYSSEEEEVQDTSISEDRLMMDLPPESDPDQLSHPLPSRKSLSTHDLSAILSSVEKTKTSTLGKQFSDSSKFYDENLRNSSPLPKNDPPAPIPPPVKYDPFLIFKQQQELERKKKEEDERKKKEISEQNMQHFDADVSRKVIENTSDGEAKPKAARPPLLLPPAVLEKINVPSHLDLAKVLTDIKKRNKKKDTDLSISGSPVPSVDSFPDNTSNTSGNSPPPMSSRRDPRDPRKSLGGSDNEEFGGNPKSSYPRNPFIPPPEVNKDPRTEFRDPRLSRDLKDLESPYGFSQGNTSGFNRSVSATGLEDLPGTRPMGLYKSSTLPNPYEYPSKSTDPAGDLDFEDISKPQSFPGNVPFHVPLHEPVTVVNASLTAHDPIPYRLTVVTIPTVSYAKITQRLSKDDPRVKEDPRLYRMFFGLKEQQPPQQSTADEIQEIQSPTPEGISSPLLDTRDPRMNRDPRMGEKTRNVDPRVPLDIRNEDHRMMSSEIGHMDSRDPRMVDSSRSLESPAVMTNNDPRFDPRLPVTSREDPRLGSRDPRAMKSADEDPNITRPGILGPPPPHGHMVMNNPYLNSGNNMTNMTPVGPNGLSMHRSMPGNMFNAYGSMEGYNMMSGPNMFGGPLMRPDMPPRFGGPMSGKRKKNGGNGPEWRFNQPEFNPDPRLQKNNSDMVSFSPPPPVS